MKRSLLIIFVFVLGHMVLAQDVIDKNLEQPINETKTAFHQNNQINNSVGGLIYVSNQTQINVSGSAIISGQIIYEVEKAEKEESHFIKPKKKSKTVKTAVKPDEKSKDDNEVHQAEPTEKEKVLFADLTGIPGKIKFSNDYQPDAIVSPAQSRVGINQEYQTGVENSKFNQSIKIFFIEENIQNSFYEHFSIRPPPLRV
ncbi:MAG: hypothetical protein WCY16_08055 [Weeksellaceae bacterium]